MSLERMTIRENSLETELPSRLCDPSEEGQSPEVFDEQCASNATTLVVELAASRSSSVPNDRKYSIAQLLAINEQLSHSFQPTNETTFPKTVNKETITKRLTSERQLHNSPAKDIRPRNSSASRAQTHNAFPNKKTSCKSPNPQPSSQKPRGKAKKSPQSLKPSKNHDSEFRKYSMQEDVLPDHYKLDCSETRQRRGLCVDPSSYSDDQAQSPSELWDDPERAQCEGFFTLGSIEKVEHIDNFENSDLKSILLEHPGETTRLDNLIAFPDSEDENGASSSRILNTIVRLPPSQMSKVDTPHLESKKSHSSISQKKTGRDAGQFLLNLLKTDGSSGKPRHHAKSSTGKSRQNSTKTAHHDNPVRPKYKTNLQPVERTKNRDKKPQTSDDKENDAEGAKLMKCLKMLLSQDSS